MAKTTRSTGASRAGVPDNPSEDVLLRGSRIVIKDGAIEFAADGNSAPDTVIRRAPGGGVSLTADDMTVTDDLSVGDDATIGGDLTVTGVTTALGYLGVGGNFGIGSGVSQGSFFGATAISKPTVSGSTGGNAALASLLTALADLGLITNSTS